MATERSTRGRRPTKQRHAGPPRKATTPAPPALTAADIAELREQLADLAAAAFDAVLPLGRRRLGRVTARETIRSAYHKVCAILASGEKGARHG
jgi:hypothetical protein